MKNVNDKNLKKASFAELVEVYYERKRRGMDFTAIRKELTEMGADQDVIKELIRQVDERILNEETGIERQKTQLERKAIAWVLIILSIALFLLTITGIIGHKGMYIIAWGPLLFGVFMLSNNTNIFRFDGRGRRNTKRGVQRLQRSQYFKR